MKLLKWFIGKSLKKNGEGLIILYQKSPNDKFKDLLCEYLFITEELQDYLKKEGYAKKGTGVKTASDMDINQQPINGSSGQDELAKTAESIQK
jgi:hypothetical protein